VIPGGVGETRLLLVQVNRASGVLGAVWIRRSEGSGGDGS
jgi:hypothetical protein